MKQKILLLLLFLSTVSLKAQSPPDNPLTPQEWVDKMRYGHWWIFAIPPGPDTNISTIYSENILDSLQTKFCINGGRLHWVAKDMYDSNGNLLQQAIDNVRIMIDDFVERDMAISLNIQFLSTNEERNMTPANKQKLIRAWTRVSDAFKDVSHNLAMCPVIEFHGWENVVPRNQRVDSLNVLYHQLTRIFRQTNPTRIMSYKPWGSAKRAEFGDLDYPFGDDPLPNSGQAFYYVSSFSGAAGLGDWQNWHSNMTQAELDALHFQTINGGSSDPNNVWGIRAAMQHRANTGIPFWCDHWRPNYHKNYGTPEQWTMEQNLAYVDFFMNKLIEIGSGGAGFQTRTFWSDQTNDLIRLNNNATDRDTMSVLFMNYLEQNCTSLSYNTSESQESEFFTYPNPVTDYLYVSLQTGHLDDNPISIYNVFGQKIQDELFEIREITDNKKMLDVRKLKKGLYLIKIQNNYVKFLKE